MTILMNGAKKKTSKLTPYKRTIRLKPYCLHIVNPKQIFRRTYLSHLFDNKSTFPFLCQSVSNNSAICESHLIKNAHHSAQLYILCKCHCFVTILPLNARYKYISYLYVDWCTRAKFHRLYRNWQLSYYVDKRNRQNANGMHKYHFDVARCNCCSIISISISICISILGRFGNRIGCSKAQCQQL